MLPSSDSTLGLPSSASGAVSRIGNTRSSMGFTSAVWPAIEANSMSAKLTWPYAALKAMKSATLTCVLAA